MFPRQALSLAALASVLPQAVLALSCLRPDLDRLWTRAASDPATYVVAVGTLEFDPAALPRPQGAGPAQTDVPARFTGHGLTQTGFTAPMAVTVTLEARCIGAWCATIEPGQDMMAFLRRDVTGHRLEITPCGGMVWPQPTATEKAHILDCLRGSDCRQNP